MTTQWTPQTAAGESAENALIPAYITEAVDAEAVIAVAAEVAIAAAPGGSLAVAIDAGVDDVAAEGTAQIALVAAQGVTSVALVAAQGVTSVGLVNTAGSTQLALIAASQGLNLFASTADALSSGVLSTTTLVGGSGGTNGTFAVAFSGGAGTNAAATFTVVGGALTSITMQSPGRGYTSAPTMAFTASAGLTGASATAVIGANATVGQYFSIPGVNGAALDVYKVETGPVATYQRSIYGSDAANPQTDLLVKARYDTQVGRDFRDYPALMPVRMYMGTLSSGVKNADGTYPIVASGNWNSPQLDYSPFIIPGAFYAYVVLTEALTGKIEIEVSRGGTILAAGNTTTQPGAPGVYYQTWNNSGSLPYVQIKVTNVSAGTVTMYPLEVYQTNTAYLPQVIRYDDVTPVAENRKIIDWDQQAPWSRWGKSVGPPESAITIGFDSVSGSDGAAGGRYAPKQNLTAGTTLAEGAVVGLKRASEWNQAVVGLGTTTKGLVLQTMFDGAPHSAFAKLNGGLDVTAYTWTATGAGSWWTEFTGAANLLNDGYSYVTVVETTDTAVAATPVAATKLLTVATSIANCDATAGSAFAVFVSGTTWRIYVRPTNSAIPAPGNIYSHAVTNIYCPVDFVANNDRAGNWVKNLEIVHGNFGLGAISSGPNSMLSGLILTNGYLHNGAAEGGTLRDTIMYSRGNPGGTTFVFYKANVSGISWKFENVIAYECASPYYSHIGPSGAYVKGEFLNCVAENFRNVTTGALIGQPAFACAQVGTAVGKWLYSRGHYTPWQMGNSAVPVAGTVSYSLARECAWHYSVTTTEQNLVQLENWSGPGAGDRFMRAIKATENHVVRYNTFWLRNVDTSGTAGTLDYNPTIFDPTFTGLNNPQLTRNLIIVDCDLATAINICQESNASMVWGSDYNVIVFFGSCTLTSAKFGVGTKHTLAEYLAEFTGHDANTTFFDYRDDPRGIDAIFADATNGDWTWAQTAAAAAVKAACIAKNAGADWTIKAWPTTPTVDEARVMLMDACSGE